MSKTYCGICDIKVEGLYLNCPRCGNWLAPYPPNDPTLIKQPPEPFTLVEFGTSWQLETNRQDKRKRFIQIPVTEKHIALVNNQE